MVEPSVVLVDCGGVLIMAVEGKSAWLNIQLRVENLHLTQCSSDGNSVDESCG